MLRTHRLVATRRALLSPALRRTSTATTTAPADPLPVPPPRRSTRPLLYSVPVLPPLPTPLPMDADPTFTYLAPTSTARNAPTTPEQMAVLNACLVSGDVTRAEEVARRIRANWAKNHTRARNYPALCAILPPVVHADFIRFYFSATLAAAPPSLSESFESAFTATTRLVKTEETKAKADINALGRNVHKAWTYFDSLLEKQWDRPLSGEMMNRNGAVDETVIATMLKGLIAAGPTAYNPSSSNDPQSWHRPITSLLPVVRKLKLNLLTALRDPIFDVSLHSYMGEVSREAVMAALVETGAGRSGWSDFEPEIARVTESLKADAEGRAEAERVEAIELNPTNSKDSINMSLETLRVNLSTLGMAPTMPGVAYQTPTARQRLLEESSYDAARQLYIHEMEQLAIVGKDKERGMSAGWLQTYMFQWMTELEKKLAADSLETGKKSPWGAESDIEPFMRLLAPNKLALITIVEMLRLGGSGGVGDGMKATRAILHVGKAIENEYHAELLKGSGTNKAFEREMERVAAGNSMGESSDKAGWSPEKTLSVMWRRELAKREKDGDTSWRPQWSQGIRAKVGSLLITALMDVAKVERRATNSVTGEVYTETQPAFTHSYQYVRGTKLGLLKVNQAIAERLDQDPLRITLHPRFLPMVVKPKPWLTWESGSYLVHSTQVMRTRDSIEQTEYLRQASEADSLDEIFSGLDVLGATPWSINRPIFDIISEVWNSGIALADIPVKDSLTSILEPEKPENYATDPRAKDTYRHRIKTAILDRRAAHSNRCDVNYKLEIARAFLNETFYFPHNLDFRGRAYPIPPNLSHIGNDLCRGLLQFGEAKPLGTRGLRWLKIHLANMAGFDKASFDEREAYAMEHLEQVYDSADKPLDGKRWWLETEDPWQCLATCMELTNALRAPVPSEFLSSLPIHQDGTCNGLQHYAALGGDLKGALQVNLDVGDRPSDVYSGVAQMANEQIEKDCLAGDMYALMLRGKVTRKVVKQTVMTTVYGVTFIGAKRQIEKQLKERGDIPPEHLYTCALYLGRIVLNSIGDVFKGATAIQNWLNRSARLISKSIPPNRIAAAQQAEPQSAAGKKKVAKNLSRIPKEQMTSVIWTTPLGLPVVQPYRKPKKRQVSTALQTVFIIDPSIPAEVDPRAQATAFPPNFIHSLDATHMMMTALACKDKLAFASVHDSYWTHADSVDEMSIILRETFIDLHSQDILGKLRQEFVARYAGHVVPLSKIPAALLKRYEKDGRRVEGTELSPQDSEAVTTALDLEDGLRNVPLFNSNIRPPRSPRAPTTAVDDDAESDETAGEEIDTEWTPAGYSTSVASKFVDLADVLPPVPPKGDFDLQRIRESLYFFS